VLFLCAIGACRSPLAPERSVEAHVQEFTGAGAVNCGRLGRTATDSEMSAALACGLDAASRAAAFSIVREYQGIDSFVAEGLVARSGGPVFKFSFDSAPCGSPGHCSESFTTVPCAAPRLGRQSNLTVFVCTTAETDVRQPDISVLANNRMSLGRSDTRGHDVLPDLR
jgi:hypothetical protein